MHCAGSAQGDLRIPATAPTSVFMPARASFGTNWWWLSLPVAVSLLALLAVAPSPTPAATRYLKAGGSDTGSCASAARACGTIGYAYDRSAPGDVIQVAAGSYGAQTVQGTKVSPGVIFDMDPHAYFTDVNVEATWVEFRNGRIDAFGWWTEARDPIPSNVTFRNITAREASFSGGRHIAVHGGSIGSHTAGAGLPAAVFLYGNGAELSDVVVDGVDFHDISHAISSDHFEAVRIDTGAHDITIRNSRFRGITANSSVVFITNVEDNAADPRNLTFENDFFAAPRSGPGGGAYYVFNMNANVGTCEGYAFRYNSFASVPASLACTTMSNVSWVGNVAPKPPGCHVGERTGVFAVQVCLRRRGGR
jgi:hypothetical protein